MRTIMEIRQYNLQRIADGYESQRVLADLVDMTPGYINQLLTGHRNLGEKSARKIEQKLHLPACYLDQDPDSQRTMPPPADFDPNSNPVRRHLDGILRACDRAMRHTGRTFNDEEKLKIYLEGIEFAGRKNLSPDLVMRYLNEVIKNNDL